MNKNILAALSLLVLLVINLFYYNNREVFLKIDNIWSIAITLLTITSNILFVVYIFNNNKIILYFLIFVMILMFNAEISIIYKKLGWNRAVGMFIFASIVNILFIIQCYLELFKK
jgi:hypothetical protein